MLVDFVALLASTFEFLHCNEIGSFVDVNYVHLFTPSMSFCVCHLCANLYTIYELLCMSIVCISLHHMRVFVNVNHVVSSFLLREYATNFIVGILFLSILIRLSISTL
jgi:hypothetical protein